MFFVDVLCFWKVEKKSKMYEEEAIFDRVQEGDIEGVRSMLDEGEDPNCIDEVSFPFFIFHFVGLFVGLEKTNTLHVSM